MTRTNPNPVAQPSLEDLMVRFLASRSDAASGSAVESAGGEVEPYEVAAGFPVDPRTAWTDATAALPEQSKPPTEWAALVGQPAAAFAVAHAAGNFPQRVKDLQPLLAKFDPAEMRPSGSQPPSPGLSGLRTWIIRETKKSQPVPALLAAGVARSIGEFDWADELLGAAEPLCAGELRATWENERAALLWHRGRSEEALAAWTAQAETPAVLFNRGMALLFLGKPADARAALTKAVAVIPEESGWNALARLYLAVAEIHG
jgi:tetratricopeptide (TPR) repeat protein